MQRYRLILPAEEIPRSVLSARVDTRVKLEHQATPENASRSHQGCECSAANCSSFAFHRDLSLED